jgi:hypothetical protein
MNVKNKEEKITVILTANDVEEAIREYIIKHIDLSRGYDNYEYVLEIVNSEHLSHCIAQQIEVGVSIQHENPLGI